jgi:hypothetical protein
MNSKRNSPVAAASATYRKAVNKIADALDHKPSHSRYPSLDLDGAIEGIPDALKEKAIEWYIRGIKRGMAKATDLMVSKKIYLKEDAVYAPQRIKVNVKTRFRGGRWKSLEVIVNSVEIGFE